MQHFEHRAAAGAAAYLLFWLYAVFVAVGANADDSNAPNTVAVELAHGLAAQNTDVVILDVRTPAEFTASHISGAVNLSVEDKSFPDLAAQLDPQKTYIVHCTRNPVDGRSERAIRAMERLGFPNIYSLDGGYVAWSEAQLPLTVGEYPQRDK